MAKRSREIWISCCLVTAFSGAARAQAITEYGGVSRQSATTTGRTIGPGKEIRGVWKGLDKTITGSADISGIPPAPRSATAQKPAVRTRKARTHRARMAAYEDPTRIQQGMSYQEVVRRFGPPSYQVATGPDAMTVSYLRKDGNVDLELRDAKVIKVAGAKQQQMAAASPK